MSRSQISHIGIAVTDLDEAVKQFTLLTGSPPAHVETLDDQSIRVAMFGAVAGGDRIELMAATSDDSPIAKFLDKRGEGLHHLCLYVDDIDKALKSLKQSGVRLIDEEPRQGAEGTRIAFVHPSSTHGVLIELEQRTGD